MEKRTSYGILRWFHINRYIEKSCIRYSMWLFLLLTVDLHMLRPSKLMSIAYSLIAFVFVLFCLCLSYFLFYFKQKSKKKTKEVITHHKKEKKFTSPQLIQNRSIPEHAQRDMSISRHTILHSFVRFLFGLHVFPFLWRLHWSRRLSNFSFFVLLSLCFIFLIVIFQFGIRPFW